MKKYRKQKTYIIAAIVIAMVSVFGCGISVYASTQGIKKIYQEVYFSTEEGTEEPMNTEELQEYHGTLEEFAGMKVVQHEEDGIETFSNVTIIDNWKIANNSAHFSNGFKVQAGGNIVVTASVVPTDKTVKVGIKKPDGNTTYVTGKNVISHTFNVSKTGTYQVFVSNASGKSVTVTGSYIIN